MVTLKCLRCDNEWSVEGKAYTTKTVIPWVMADYKIQICKKCSMGDKTIIKRELFMLIDAIKNLQKELNLGGANPKLTEDGVAGPLTLAELAKQSKPVSAMPTLGSTPWRDWFIARKGWTEFNHDAELSKGWPLVGLPQYKTVIGTSHAWCGMSLATALTEYGYRIPKGAAGAANWDGYGSPIDWKTHGIPKAAVVRLHHAGGGAHVTTADRDHAPGETVLDALGGNQGDSIRVSRFNVSGNAHGHDEIAYVAWPVKV